MKKIIFSLLVFLCIGSTNAWSQSTNQSNSVELRPIHQLDGITTGYKSYFYPWQGCQTQMIYFKARQSPATCKSQLLNCLSSILNLGWVRVDIMTEPDSDNPRESLACQGWMRFTLLSNSTGVVRNIILNTQYNRAQVILYQDMRYPWQ